MTIKTITEAAAILGRRGGKAGTGASKRPSTAHSQRAGRARWAAMTAEERSEAMRRVRLGTQRDREE
jgi:hypothetical protein